MSPNSNLKCDVLVVGLGPAGASAARVAAQSGCKVIAVDRKKQAGLPVQCAEFVPSMLSPTLPAATKASCQPIKEMHTFVEDRAADLSENFSGAMLDRAKFDELLVDDARSAGALCNFGLSVTGFHPDGAVDLSDGRKVKAAIIIGADGPWSIVGRAINSINQELVISRQITVPLLVPHVATDIFLSRKYRGGYAWLFPRGNVANIGIGVVRNAKQTLKPGLAELHSALIKDGRVGAEIISRTGGAIPVGGMIEPIGNIGEYIGQGENRNMGQSVGYTHVYLVGDAAGLTNPITGAGISAAVLSGQLAGESAVQWLAGNDADSEYLEELQCLFGASLQRALLRRKRLLSCYAVDREPSCADLRETWVGYSQYWAQDDNDNLDIDNFSGTAAS